jgi:DNA primase
MSGIDFRALRGQVQLAQVLELVRFEPTVRRGPCVRGPCPVHGSQPRSRSFAAHLEWQCWHCFRCGAHGNALDLWLAVTRLPVNEGALALCARLGLEVPRLSRPAARSPPRQ